MPTWSADSPVKTRPSTGLVLTGGGARAAYQAGVLKAVCRLLADASPQHAVCNPFDVICGTSAGAINAAALACAAHRPRSAVRRIVGIWENLETNQVYRADSIGVAATGVRWLSMLSFGWMLARLTRDRPRSFLDSEPLIHLLREIMDFRQLEENLEDGVLSAVAVTASGYSSGRHLTFYQTPAEVPSWQRALRQAVRERITLDHLLASSAIPFIFPARRVRVGDTVEWCGDGAMRQLAPLSPAIHLGADRIMVVATGRSYENPPVDREDSYPSLAQVAGHALSNIFLDSVAADCEQAERINAVARQLTPEMQKHLNVRPVRILAITPSQNLDEIAARHVCDLPATMRALLGAIGVSADPGRTKGSALVSYILFEQAYTRELVELGWQDTLARADEVRDFFDIPQATS